VKPSTSNAGWLGGVADALGVADLGLQGEPVGDLETLPSRLTYQLWALALGRMMLSTTRPSTGPPPGRWMARRRDQGVVCHGESWSAHWRPALASPSTCSLSLWLSARRCE